MVTQGDFGTNPGITPCQKGTLHQRKLLPTLQMEVQAADAAIFTHGKCRRCQDQVGQVDPYWINIILLALLNIGPQKLPSIQLIRQNGYSTFQNTSIFSRQSKMNQIQIDIKDRVFRPQNLKSSCIFTLINYLKRNLHFLCNLLWAGIRSSYESHQFKFDFKLQMDQSLPDELNSMMQSVSRNIGLYDLTPEPLYTGRNSQIFHIVSQHDHKSQALKAIAKRIHARKPEDVKAAYLKERKIHETLKNRYIVQLENAFSDESTFYMVLQYCSKGSLRANMKYPLPIQTIRNFGEQIARGLSYLHKAKIVHGDLKPENILLTNEGEIKICDFGESFKLEEKNGGNLRGQLAYAPPEAIQIANEQRDVWAFGCIMHEMATGNVPFTIKSWKELAIILSNNYLKNFPFSSTLQPALLHLLKQIFVHDTTKRLKIEDVLLHPFFTNEPLISIIITEKSQEHLEVKKPKTSRSKPAFKSLQLKETNKQNKNAMNIPITANQTCQPDYKKLLEKKFREEGSKVLSKNEENSKLGSKQNSGKKASLKIYEELGGKISKANLNYNVRKNIFQSRKNILSPLHTDGMIIKEIDKKKSKIMIDRDGFTRCGETDWMNISCDGKIIKFRKNGTEKVFSFDTLPEKYYDKYEEAKKIIKQIMSCTPKVTYKDQELELIIMFNNEFHAKFRDGPDFKNLQLQKILKNHLSLDEQRASMLQKVALALLSLKRK